MALKETKYDKNWNKKNSEAESNEAIKGLRVNYPIIFLSGLLILIASILTFLLIIKNIYGNYELSEILPTKENLKDFRYTEKVGILYSDYTANMLGSDVTWVQDNIDTWKEFLKNLKINYEVFTDLDLEEVKHKKYNLIILAGAKSMSDKEVVQIKKYIDEDFDAVRADITIFNTVYAAIRLYDVKNYDIVYKLQQAFKSEGFNFKNKTTNIEGKFLIKLWKVFLVEMVDKGLYMNRSKSKMSYFTINKHFSYKHFQVITQKVKNNWNGKSFDAAMGVFYRKNKMEEVVRVFSNSIDIEMTTELQTLYKKIIDQE